MFATNPSEYYEEFMEHQAPNVHWVFVKLDIIYDKSSFLAAGKITFKIAFSQLFCEYLCRIFEYERWWIFIFNYCCVATKVANMQLCKHLGGVVVLLFYIPPICVMYSFHCIKHRAYTLITYMLLLILFHFWLYYLLVIMIFED